MSAKQMFEDYVVGVNGIADAALGTHFAAQADAFFTTYVDSDAPGSSADFNARVASDSAAEDSGALTQAKGMTENQIAQAAANALPSIPWYVYAGGAALCIAVVAIAIGYAMHEAAGVGLSAK